MEERKFLKILEKRTIFGMKLQNVLPSGPPRGSELLFGQMAWSQGDDQWKEHGPYCLQMHAKSQTKYDDSGELSTCINANWSFFNHQGIIKWYLKQYS